MAKAEKIRIAVAINEEGNWFAYGFKGCQSWKEATECFDMLDGVEARYWVEVEIPIPELEPEVIFGEVKDAK